MFKVIKFQKLDSTNKYALEHIETLQDGDIIQAEVQSAGRGRFSRKWISDIKNNCYISFVLKPNLKYRNNFPNLTQYLSLVLCQTIEKYCVKPQIKWPNDVQINGKKIAGILSEVAFLDGVCKGIVLGIGVNLNLKKTNLMNIDIPATSLNIETNKTIDSDDFIKKLIEGFFTNYNKIIENGFSAIRAEYLSYCNFIGKEIMIKNPQPSILGTAINVTENGSLEVLNKDGAIEKIISGDVILN